MTEGVFAGRLKRYGGLFAGNGCCGQPAFLVKADAMHAKLCEDIHWVGYVDWNVRDFHSYQTDRGTTYNAYLLCDQQPALIDTVKAPYAEVLLERVSALCPLEQLAYVVCNHAEPDHSSALPRVMQAARNATLLCNRKCAEALRQHYDTSAWRIQVVGSGQEVALGRRSLRFIDTPMVHWPESMFTYVPEQGLLFSMDAFGQHYASSQRFDDELPLATVLEEAKSYYANIVMPYAKAVEQALQAVAGLAVRMIAPSHGAIWRSSVAEILSAYRHWAGGRPAPKVLVVYDTMWDSTGQMAEAIVEGAQAACSGQGPQVGQGNPPGRALEVLLIHLRRSSLTRLATEMLDAAAVALGSPTLHRHMMPSVAAALCHLEGLRPAPKTALAFGSYGWGPGGPEAIQQWLDRMQWPTLGKPLRAQYRPTAEVLQQCRAAGAQLAQRVLEASAAFSGSGRVPAE